MSDYTDNEFGAHTSNFQREQDRLKRRQELIKQLYDVEAERDRVINEVTPWLEGNIARYNKSIAGRLGLEMNGVTHQALNLPTHALSGASRLVGNILTSLPSLGNSINGLTLDDRVRNSYNNLIQGKTTEEDIRILSEVNSQGLSNLDQIKNYIGTQKSIQKVRKFFDLSDLTYDTNRGRMLADFNKAKSTGDYLSAIANPMGVLGYVSENLPNIYGGVAFKGVPLALDALSNTHDIVTRGEENYAKNNQGAIQSRGDYSKSLAWAALGSALDAGATERLGHFASKALRGAGNK